MSLPRFLVHPAALALFACGAFTVASCSAPVPPPFQGALSATLGNATGQNCPAPGPLTVGAVNATDRVPVSDGDNGASVSCKVVAAAGGFVAEGTLSAGDTNFSMTNVAIQGDTGTGTVRLGGASTAGIYASEGPCTFTLIQPADAGRIWTKFSCPTLKSASALNAECSVVDGIVIFENCLTQ